MSEHDFNTLETIKISNFLCLGKKKLIGITNLVIGIWTSACNKYTVRRENVSENSNALTGPSLG